VADPAGDGVEGPSGGRVMITISRAAFLELGRAGDGLAPGAVPVVAGTDIEGVAPEVLARLPLGEPSWYRGTRAQGPSAGAVDTIADDRDRRDG
jgi:hypothetical protein